MSTDTQGNSMIGQWKVIYMGGIPNYPGILWHTLLSVHLNGFYLTSPDLGTQYFDFSRVITWRIIQERSAYATSTSNAAFGPRHIRIEYVDQNGDEHVILLEMVHSVFLAKSASICKEMMTLMNKHKIFTKFYLKPTTEETDCDIISQIERLGELRKAGILTDAEFESKKAELLKRL